jgi:glucan phosphoethanolaminetransferase (alkaline phosphatase superfamily)
MELDDLRRQWRQAEPVKANAALNASKLTELLARQSGGVVENLRCNARLELRINYGVLVASLALVVLASDLWVRLFGAVLTLLAGICIFYFYRKLGLLRNMDNPAGDLRAHLTRLASGLRALIRFYYRLTLATIPVTISLMGLIAVSETHTRLTPSKLGIIAAVLVALAIFIYLPIAHMTAKYLQRLYGQHLDRLESQLRELDEPAAALPPPTTQG